VRKSQEEDDDRDPFAVFVCSPAVSSTKILTTSFGPSSPRRLRGWQTDMKWVDMDSAGRLETGDPPVFFFSSTFFFFFFFFPFFLVQFRDNHTSSQKKINENFSKKEEKTPIFFFFFLFAIYN
jgi:hypothetical protein